MKKYHYVYKLKIINPIDERLYYIGCRSSNCHPKDDRYFSSSKEIKKMIKDGHKFTKKILKNFDYREEAISYEIELHNRFNVSFNSKFFNKVKQSSKKFDSTGLIFINGNPISTENYKNCDLKYHSCGKVSVKDNNGNFYYVDVNDRRYVNKELVHVSKGLVPVLIDGVFKMIKTEDYDKEKYKSSNKNKIAVVDQDGNKFLLDKKDEIMYNKFIEGELSSVHKGKILAKDKNGNILYVNKDDFKNLGLSGINKNKINGSNNPNAKKIFIYNNDNNLEFECKGNFKEICKTHKLPFISLYRSYNNNGERIYNTKRGKNEALKKRNERFIGWYALLV